MTEENKEILTPDLLDRLRFFFQDNNSCGISRNLRKVFFDYLRQQNAGLDVEFDTILNDIEAVINLLEFAGDQTKEYREQFT